MHQEGRASGGQKVDSFSFGSNPDFKRLQASGSGLKYFLLRSGRTSHGVRSFLLYGIE